MKQLILLLTLASLPLCAHCRDVHPSRLSDTIALRRHVGLWFTPNRRSTEIDGLALGIWTAAENHDLIIKGVNVEANPAAPFLLVFEFMGCMLGPFTRDTSGDMHELAWGSLPDRPAFYQAKITGLSLSTAQMAGNMKGLGINVVSSSANEVSGLEVSGMMNLHYRSRGVLLAIRNRVTWCNGVQIGLFNETRGGKLLQIGLYNRIGNRRLPLINCNFKTKK